MRFELLQSQRQGAAITLDRATGHKSKKLIAILWKENEAYKAYWLMLSTDNGSSCVGVYRGKNWLNASTSTSP